MPQPECIEQLSKVHADTHVAGWVILTPEKARNSWRFPGEYEPLWSPTTNLVTEVLSLVPDYLSHAGFERLAHPAYTGKLPEIRDKLPESWCQVIGVTYEKQQAIFLNFLPVGERWTKHWRDEYTKVYDGGPRFWSVVFMSEEQKFTQLRIDLGY